MHFGIPRTIDTTETLHCLSLNLQRVKRKFWQHQDLKLESRRYNYNVCIYKPNQVLSLFLSLSITTFRKHYFMSHPRFEIKNNQDLIRIGVNECDSFYEY